MDRRSNRITLDKDAELPTLDQMEGVSPDEEMDDDDDGLYVAAADQGIDDAVGGLDEPGVDENSDPLVEEQSEVDEDAVLDVVGNAAPRRAPPTEPPKKRQVDKTFPLHVGAPGYVEPWLRRPDSCSSDTPESGNEASTSIPSDETPVNLTSDDKLSTGSSDYALLDDSTPDKSSATSSTSPIDPEVQDEDSSTGQSSSDASTDKKNNDGTGSETGSTDDGQSETADDDHSTETIAEKKEKNKDKNPISMNTGTGAARLIPLVHGKISKERTTKRSHPNDDTQPSHKVFRQCTTTDSAQVDGNAGQSAHLAFVAQYAELNPSSSSDGSSGSGTMEESSSAEFADESNTSNVEDEDENQS